MREVVSDIGRVVYPEEFCFAFNPNRVVVETEKDVTLSIKHITDVREPMNGKVEIDVSKYLQLFVSQDVRHADVTVKLSTSDGEFSFSLRVVWGAINIGERFNGDFTLRWWKGLPFTMEMYIPADVDSLQGRYDGNGYSNISIGSGYVSVDPATVWPNATEKVVVRADEGESPSVWDYTFDHTFRGVNVGDTRMYRLVVKEASVCGLYLRWVDRHGWLRYWLFDEGKSTTTSKALNSVECVSVEPYDFPYMSSRYIGKEADRSVRLCAPLVTDEELDVLEQLPTAAVVDLWTGEGWVPVNIEGMSVTRGGKDWPTLNDFECVMVYPEVMTQRL